MASISALAVKFRGCMIGSHVGDCLGAPFEGDLSISKLLVSKYITNLLGDPKHVETDDTSKISHAANTLTNVVHPYTDDTAMTMSVAKSLAAKKAYEAKDVAVRFVEEYYRNRKRGYGLNVVDVFSALKELNYNDVYFPAQCQFGNTGSYGNGAAMRTAPIALFCHNKPLDTVKQIAKDCALITHAHQYGYNGAILQCLAVHQALKSTNSSELDPVAFVDQLLKKMETIEERLDGAKWLEDKRPFCSSLKWMKDQFEKKALHITPNDVAKKLGNGVAAHRSVPSAIYSFLRSLHPIDDFTTDNPFVRAMYFAICVGGDTDTIAAMTGSIAGAYHGEEKIPISFQNRCEGIGESKILADELYNVCCND